MSNSTTSPTIVSASTFGGAPPTISPQDQVDFLLKLQRLLRSGETTSTYKYAMLISLADLAVELRDEVIPLELVADKFIELYWQMSVVYPGGGRTDILTQVTPSSRTPHAAITVLLRDLIAVEKTLAKAKEKQSWSKLWSEVRGKVVQKYVLEALQRVDRQIDPFIYDPAKAKEEKKITLTPTAKLCFRQFHGLITDQVRGAWLGFVRRFNQPVIGESTDLSAFLFGDGRARLDAYVPLLQDMQEGRCFYCQSNLKPTPEVDHFVPWSLYHADLGHNFVLAHRGCNGDKRDFLADEDHLERWVERNTTWAGKMEAFFRNEHLPFDHEATKSITRWAYDGLVKTKGLAWRKGRTATTELRGDWVRLLST
jgi:hypothetical protein